MRKWVGLCVVVGLFVTGCSSDASTTEPVDNMIKKKEVENVSVDELLNKTGIAVEYNQLLIGDKPDTWKILVRDDKTIAIMNFIKTLPGGDSAYKAWMGEDDISVNHGDGSRVSLQGEETMKVY
ncbi:hypothetical protein JI666_13940 [Bacillus sp. NTK071]|uniref:hypothetical protein n=1 Tax=Bacillus sp. NTK071 TaxID=2802175 RepID=UPI001A8D5A1D|nr:hypothetical protein [Bacillus sp. NTK071]MBN8209853.1 hypothetical protein [Bacillus sp. NTK071]